MGSEDLALPAGGPGAAKINLLPLYILVCPANPGCVHEYFFKMLDQNQISEVIIL